jgi:hypothetical protein
MKIEKQNKVSGPRRDELEVGLARHRKPESFRLPKWFVEYGGLGFAALLLIVFLAVAYRSSGSLFFGETERKDITSLRFLEVSKKVWQDGSSTDLKMVEIRVANAGAYPAKSVKIFAAAGNMKVPMIGVDSIEVGKSVLFSTQEVLAVRPGRELFFTYECGNCGAGRF